MIRSGISTREGMYFVCIMDHGWIGCKKEKGAAREKRTVMRSISSQASSDPKLETIRDAILAEMIDLVDLALKMVLLLL